MLSRYNPVDIEDALRSVSPEPQFPAASDRSTWGKIRTSIGEERAKACIAQAKQDALAPIPDLPATLWLEFKRIGRREGYEQPQRSQRRRLLWSLTLAECLENKGRFLDPLMNIIWATCEESSWSWPAHQIALTDMERPIIDLSVAMTALELAEIDALLGAALNPLVGKRIRYEVNRRCFVPYLTRHDFWWMHNSNKRTVNNWTAVCTSGVVGAAIYLEPDPSRLAEIIARGARSMDDYLSTFDSDGGSTEGPGYWAYGFGYFTILANLVEARSAGKISFWTEDGARKAAVFPAHTQLSTGHFTNFSDCNRGIAFPAPLLSYLGKRMDVPYLQQLAREQPLTDREERITWGLRNLFWRPAAQPAGPYAPLRHDWYGGMHWMIARLDPADASALVLAAKGGHNGEMHNQNDVGNIIVHVNGESLIPDLGRGRYTRAYFGPDRYKHFVNSSRGHSVPIVNGCEQLPGKDHAASVLDHQATATLDSLSIEMKDVYPAEADLASLTRSVTLHRSGPRGAVELCDTVHFANHPGSLESVLTTFARASIGASSVVIEGEHGALTVSFDPASVAARVEVVKQVDLAEGAADGNLVIFALRQPAQQASIRLHILPS